MADTRVQTEVEDWVRREWFPRKFGQRFRRERLKLRSGGVFDFDAVSEDDSIVASISTSGGTTAKGKHAIGKFMKIRSDMLFLMMATTVRRLVVLTDRGMYDLCLKERSGGRVPPEIEFEHAPIPKDLAAKLTAAQKAASDEVSPKGV